MCFDLGRNDGEANVNFRMDQYSLLLPTWRDPTAKRVVFTDFDGTLADIVPNPPDARPVDGAVQALVHLIDQGIGVGVITGRPVEFVQDLLGLEDVIYRGQHGMARAYGLEESKPVDAVLPVMAQLEPIKEAIEKAFASDPDVRREDKQLGITLHFRNATDPGAVSKRVEAVASKIVAGSDFQLIGGRRIWEIMPRVGVDKGTALRDEVAILDADAVAFIGDDVGDLPAFAVLDDLAQQGKTVLKIAVLSPEAPEDLGRLADLVFAKPVEVAQFLADFPG